MAMQIQSAGLATGKVHKDNTDPTTTIDQQTLIDGLNHDLAGEYQAIGDIGLKVNLENQVADETRHMEEIERILAGWREL